MTVPRLDTRSLPAEPGTEPPEWATGHRFYVAPEAIQDDTVHLEGAMARQIARVLRLRPGDTIRVFYGTATEYRVRLETVRPDALSGRITGAWEPRTECACRLSLAVALLKADKLEWVIQKAVELGACGILLTRTGRSVVRADETRFAERRERYERIAREATEQCGRLAVPAIEGPTSWTDALRRAATVDAALIAHERAAVPLRAALGRPPRSALLYTGPEGGFTAEEIGEAERAGVTPVSLGRRVLRAETAALAGVALLLSHVEESD